MSNNKLTAILKGGAWLTLASLVQRLAGFLILPLLARLLDPTGLGTYSLIQQTIQTGDNFSRLGVDAAVHRNGSQHETLGKEAVGRLFGVGATLIISVATLLAFTLWLASSEIATHFLGEPKLKRWLPLAGLIIIITASADVPRLYLVALHAFRFYSIRDSTTVIVGGSITIILAFFFGLSGAIYGLLVTALIRLIWGGWLAFLLLREKQIHLRFDYFFQEATNLLSFGLPFYLSNFLSNLIMLPLLGWLTRLGGVEQVGYIRVAQSLSQLLSFIPVTVGPVIISYLSASYARNQEEYQKLKSIHIRSLWSLMIVASVAICFSLEFVIPILFGETYYDNAILLSKIMIWIVFFNTLSGMLSQYLLSSGKTRTIAIWKTGGLFITITSAFLMIPQYQAIGFLLSKVFGALFTLFGYAKPVFSMMAKTDLNTIKKLIFSSLISVLITSFLPILIDQTILLVGIESLILIILSWIIILFTFSYKEKQTLKDTPKMILQKLNWTDRENK